MIYRIALICFAYDHLCGGLLRKGLEQLGHTVIIMDSTAIERKIRAEGGYNYYLTYRNPYHLTIPENIDFVIVDHLNPLVLWVDTTKPIVYWHREQYWIPSCINATHIVYGNPEAKAFLELRYPWVQTYMRDETNLYYCADYTRYKTRENRIREILFIGAEDTQSNIEDWIFRTAYEHRKNILSNIEKYCEIKEAQPFIIHNMHYKSFQEYEELISKYEAHVIVFGRTVAGLRLWETAAAGCIPVIWIDPDQRLNWESYLEYNHFKPYKPGNTFVGNENCYYFSDLGDLMRYYEIPEEQRDIMRDNALKTSICYHTPLNQATKLIEWLESINFIDSEPVRDIKEHTKISQYLTPVSYEYVKYRTSVLGTEPKKYMEYLDWLYNGSPDGPAMIYAYRTPDNAIASTYCLLPQTWAVFGDMYRATLTFDVATHPSFERRGLFTTMGKYCMNNIPEEHRGIFSLGFPNEKAMKGHRIVGYKILGEKPILYYETNELDSAKVTNPSGYINIVPVTRFINTGPLMDQFKLKWKYIRLRFAQHLNWRFIEQPRIIYNMFILNHDDVTVGYIIVKVHWHEDRPEYRYLQIVDFLIPNIVDVYHDIHGFLLLNAQRLRCDQIDLMINPTDGFSKYLVDHGFKKMDKTGQIIIYPHDPKFADIKLEDMYLTYSDMDNY